MQRGGEYPVGNAMVLALIAVGAVAMVGSIGGKAAVTLASSSSACDAE
jgi:hypothetical protein